MLCCTLFPPSVVLGFSLFHACPSPMPQRTPKLLLCRLFSSCVGLPPILPLTSCFPSLAPAVCHLTISLLPEPLPPGPVSKSSPRPPPPLPPLPRILSRCYQGVLHLVDLAGSERLDRSGAGNDAQRLRETQAINKSLSCLADVFSALSAKASHVPFRNSKLTYLMQVWSVG